MEVEDGSNPPPSLATPALLATKQELTSAKIAYEQIVATCGPDCDTAKQLQKTMQALEQKTSE
eukprot:3836788-Karenia_brevis.AAC.1